MQLPLSLELRPSRTLLGLLLAMHIVALAASALATLALGLHALLAIALLYSAATSLRALSGPRRVRTLLLRGDGRLDWVRQSGAHGEAAVDAQSTVLPWLVIALLRRLDGGREALVVLPDSCAAQDWRQLRLWLRWRAETA